MSAHAVTPRPIRVTPLLSQWVVGEKAAAGLLSFVALYRDELSAVDPQRTGYVVQVVISGQGRTHRMARMGFQSEHTARVHFGHLSKSLSRDSWPFRILTKPTERKRMTPAEIRKQVFAQPVVPFSELQDGEWYVMTWAGMSSVVRAHHRPEPWGRGFTTVRGHWHGLDTLDEAQTEFRLAPKEHI